MSVAVTTTAAIASGTGRSATRTRRTRRISTAITTSAARPPMTSPAAPQLPENGSRP